MSKSENKRPLKGHPVNFYPDRFVIVDIETTGRSPEHDHISEISMVRFVDGEETENFSSLLRPPYAQYNGHYTSAFTAELTGITHDMLAAAPPASDVLKDFRDFVQDDILVGHNVNFDINFLYDNCMRNNLQPLTNDFIDTLKLARSAYPEMQSHKLGDLADKFHVSYEGAHRALTDCYITKQVLDHLLDRSELTFQVGDHAQMTFY